MSEDKRGGRMREKGGQERREDKQGEKVREKGGQGRVKQQQLEIARRIPPLIDIGSASY